MSQASTEQAASVEETSASVEEMSASIAQNTENAKVTDGMAGKAARERAPRSSHGEWEPAVDRPDPVEVLETR